MTGLGLIAPALDGYLAFGLTGAGATEVTATELRAAIVALLKTDAAMTALVAGRVEPAGGSLTPADDPGDPMPAQVRYWVVSRVGSRTMGGRPTGLVARRVQFDCWAGSLMDAMAVAARLEELLDGFSGLLGGLPVKSCRLEAEQDLHDPDPAGGEQDIFRVSADYVFRYRAADAAG